MKYIILTYSFKEYCICEAKVNDNQWTYHSLNAPRSKVSCSTKATYTYPTTTLLNSESSNFTKMLPPPDTQGTKKHLNSLVGTTTGPLCETILPAMSETATPVNGAKQIPTENLVYFDPY